MSDISNGHSYSSTLKNWTTVGILLFLYVLSLLDRQILPLLAISVQRDLHLSDFQLGALQGLAFALFYASAGLMMGWAIDRYSRRLVIFFGVLFWSVSCSSGGLASSFGALFLSRLGVGLGEAALTPGAFSIFRDIFPPKRLATAIGVFTTGAGFGYGVSYVFGSRIISLLSAPPTFIAPLMTHFRLWQAAFILAGLPGALLAFSILLIPEPPRRQSVMATDTMMAPVMACFRKHPILLPCHMFGFAFAFMYFGAVTVWTPVYLARHFGWTPVAIGNSLAVCFGVMLAIGSLTTGLVADRLFAAGVRDIFFRAMIGVLIIGILAIVGAFSASSPQVFLVLLSIFGFTIGTAGPLAGTSLQLIAPSGLGGRLTAVYLFLQNLIGLGCGPLMVGAVTDHVLHDPARVGTSIAITASFAGIVSLLLLALAMAPFRAAIAYLRPG